MLKGPAQRQLSCPRMQAAEVMEATRTVRLRAAAHAWLERGNPWRAAPHLQQLARQRDRWPDTLWRCLEALVRSGDVETAWQWLERTREEFEGQIQWHTSRALTLQKLGRLREAREAVAESQARFPRHKGLQKRAEDLDRRLAEMAAIGESYRRSATWARLSALRGRHAGERCFIIGNGPSLQQQDLRWLAGETTFVTNWFVNHPDCAAIAPTWYVVCSHTLFGGWGPDARPAMNPEFRERLLAVAAGSHKVFSYKFEPLFAADAAFDGQAVDYLIFDNPKRKIHAEGGIHPELSGFQHNGFTGILTFCFPLAFHLGFSEIVLLGCDCDYGLRSPESPKRYFYPPELHTSPTTRYENLVREWAPGGPVFQAYDVIAREAARRGVRVWNATAGGRLEAFPRRPLASFRPGAPEAS